MDDRYNYERFDPGLYPYTEFGGPGAGEEAVDFELATPEGERVRLSSLRGRTVVLETGSLTCPMYVRNIPSMTAIAERFPEVAFLVLYVREAHPGGRIPPHGSMESKCRQARRIRAEEREGRTIVVDDLDGRVHRAYGAMPNMVYVISPTGRVRYRTDWSNWKRLEQVLADPDGEAVVRDQHFEPPTPPWRVAWRVLARSGWRSIWDLVQHGPAMLRKHREADRVFAAVTTPPIARGR